MDWKALWSKFRGTIYFRIAYLLLVSLLGALSLATTIACFAFLILPVLTLLVPHWFGERRVKQHALNGVFVMAVATLLFAALITPSYMAQDEFVLDRQGTRVSVSDGIVRPFRANSGPGDFNFTITMWSNDTDAGNFSVRVRVLSLVGFDVANDTADMVRDVSGNGTLFDGSLANGERFFAVVRLEPYAHSYSFQAFNRTSGTILVATLGVPGPFNAPYSTYFSLWLFNGFFNIVWILAGFYLLLLIYWWTRKAREVRGTRPDRGRKRDEGGGEYTCTNCGGDVSEADTKCPNCGAEFGPGTEPSEAPEAKT